MSRTVVLLSGGIDSAVCLAIASQSRRPDQILALSFRYGQTHLEELERAAQIAAHYSVEHKIMDLDLTWSSSLTGQGVIETDGHLDRDALPSTWVPGRNLVFLAIAVAEAAAGGQVYIGVNQLDFSGYPDCRGTFIDAFRLATKRAFDGDGPVILAPLLHLTKARVISTGLNLGAPLDLTLSCYQPEEGKPCGVCDSCRIRIAAYEEVIQ